MKIEQTVEINRPPEDVYDFVANVSNLTRCSDAIQEVRNAPDGPVSEGDTYTSVAKLMGQKIETSHKVVKAVPPTMLEINGTTGSTNIRVQMEIEPTGSGCRVTQRGEGKPGGAMRFVGGMIERTMKRQMRSDLDNMKKLLESDA